MMIKRTKGKRRGRLKCYGNPVASGYTTVQLKSENEMRNFVMKTEKEEKGEENEFN